jgi:hypothetical protein
MRGVSAIGGGVPSSTLSVRLSIVFSAVLILACFGDVGCRHADRESLEA